MFLRNLPIALFGLSVLCLSACNTVDKDDPHGSEVENELGVGRLYLADGKPAVNARVRVYPAKSLPNPDAFGAPKRGAAADLVYSTFTDDKGRYRLDPLLKGEVNILGERDSELSLLESVFLTSQPEYIPPDTLDEAGGLSGVVALQQNHDPRTVTVQLLGTNEFVNVDRKGNFVFGSLAAGRYRARVSTTEPGYTLLFVSLKVEAGKVNVLADTLRPVFTGIPVVTGLSAVYDTAKGIVNLKWNAVDYPNFSRFQVFRDPKGALVLSNMPIGETKDTVYQDMVFRNGAAVIGLGQNISGTDPFGNSKTAPQYEAEYRIKVINGAEKQGDFNGFIPVRIVPPSQVATSMDFGVIGGNAGVFSINDSIKLAVHYRNPTRKQVRLKWYVGDGSGAVRTANVSGLDGFDTLVVSGMGSPGFARFRVEAEDDAGDIWSAAHSVEVVLDPPTAMAGSDTTVYYKGSEVILHSTGSDRFGAIVRWEWNIGGTGVFRRTGPGDTAIHFDSIPNAGVPCVLRVTDDDGVMDLDTLTVFPTSSKVVSTMSAPRYAMSTAALDGKIYVMGGVAGITVTDEVLEFTPGTGGWKKVASLSEPLRDFSVQVLDGKIYAGPGKALTGEVSPMWLNIYDPGKDEWVTSSLALEGRGYPIPAFAVSEGGIYGLWPTWYNNGTKYVFEARQFSQKTGEWIYWGFITLEPYSEVVTIQEHIYSLLWGDRVNIRKLDPSTHSSAGLFEFPLEPPVRLENITMSAVLDGRYYFLVGTQMRSIEISTQKLRVHPRIAIPRSGASMCAANGKLYIFGGGDQLTGKPELTVEEYTPID